MPKSGGKKFLIYEARDPDTGEILAEGGSLIEVTTEGCKKSATGKVRLFVWEEQGEGKKSS